MHVNNIGEFEELVHDIKCPLLILFITRWTKNTINWGEINRYKKYINIISIDVGNMPELVARHGLHMTPSTVMYKDGRCKHRVNCYSPLYVENIIKHYGVKDE